MVINASRCCPFRCRRVVRFWTAFRGPSFRPATTWVSWCCTIPNMSVVVAGRQTDKQLNIWVVPGRLSFLTACLLHQHCSDDDERTIEFRHSIHIGRTCFVVTNALAMDETEDQTDGSPPPLLRTFIHFASLGLWKGWDDDGYDLNVWP